MKQFANGYVSNRVLKLNVGFLLADGPGHSHDTSFDVPAIRVADDVDLLYIRGPMRLSRTKEGILVQGHLHVGVEEDCIRCLEPVQADLALDIEELYAYPARPDSEFSVGEDAVLDLAPLMRDEVMIATTGGVMCSEDCKGLCPDCGTNLNLSTCKCADENVDPRFAKLQELLNTKR